MPTPQVMILGAGPAGCAAAIALSKRGIFPTIVEQHRFPRDKVCGECLSALGIAVLRRLGVDDQIRGLGAVQLLRGVLNSTDGANVVAELSSEMWGISRWAMDQAMLQSARDWGAAVMQPVRCEKIEANLTPRVSLRDLANNMVSEHRPDYLIIADGKGALLDPRPPMTADLGVKTHLAGVEGPAETIELFGFQGHYGGLAPIEGGRWNFAMNVPASRVKRISGNFDALLQKLSEENPVFGHRLRNAKRIGPWLAAPLPRFAVRRDWPPGIIPIGNAAAALEPIGGEGMGLAMRSAERAADAIANAAHNRTKLDTARLIQSFDALWRTRRIACRAVGWALSSPTVASALLSSADAFPDVKDCVLRWFGKTTRND